MFCNDEENNYVLLDLYHKKYLFLMEEKLENIDLDTVDYIITGQYYSSLINEEEKVYLLESNQKIGSLDIKEDGLISFLAYDYRICLYPLNSSYSKHLSCDFLYLAKNNYNVYLNQDIKVLIYNKDIEFSNQFLEKIYLNWIDIYPVNTCLKIEFQEEDFMIYDVE